MADEDEEDDSLSFKVASVLSQVYAKFQAKAGETVGVKPGAAWREALEAASSYGGSQVSEFISFSFPPYPSLHPPATQKKPLFTT